MRSINRKNKISFNVFGALVVLALALLGFFGFHSVSQAAEQYHVSAGSVVYDAGMNRVDMADSGVVQKKWTGKYYLKLNNGGTYDLGTYSVIYDGGSNALNIVGDAHQVFTDGSVKNFTGKTEVTGSNQVSLFKLADRSYLFSAPTITDTDQAFSTKRYVQVTMDKSGNALLTNDQVDMKTVKPMKLTSGKVTFDIPNERLIYGEQTVDLKQVLGSTNQYKESAEDAKSKDATDNGKAGSSVKDDSADANGQSTAGTNGSVTVNGNGGNGGNASSSANASSGNGSGNASTDNSGNNNANNSGNNSGNNNNNSGDNSGNNSGNNVQNLARAISLRGVDRSVSSLTVRYYVQDPEDKFVSVYLLVKPVGASDDEEQRIGLDKANTDVTVNGLKPNTQYQLTLGYQMYATVDGESVLQDNAADVTKARTKAITSSVEVTKISSTKLYYRVKLDQNYTLESVKVGLYTSEDTTNTMPAATYAVNVTKAQQSGGVTGVINLTDVFGTSQPDIYVLKLEQAKFNGDDVELNAKCIIENTWWNKFTYNLFRNFN